MIDVVSEQRIAGVGVLLWRDCVLLCTENVDYSGQLGSRLELLRVTATEHSYVVYAHC